jgi:hypothetical protein
MTDKMNRRKMLSLAGAGSIMLTSAPAWAGGLGSLTGLMGNATGAGGSSTADFKGFAASLSKAIKLIAKQTEKLLKIQADYAQSVDLLNLAEKLKYEAANLRKGDTTGASSLKTVAKLSESAGKEITKKVNKADSLSKQQKSVLSKGLESHASAIQSMWVGVLETAVVLSQFKKVGKPSITDLEAMKDFKQIATDAPIALNFGKTSKATYEAYAKAFEAKGVYVAPKNRKLNLKKI